MAVHDEILVRRVLVLAHPRLDYWRALQTRKAKLHIFADVPDRFRRWYALLRSRISLRPARIIGRLETAPLIARDSVEHTGRPVVDPRGHLGFGVARVAGRHAKEEHFLARGADPFTDHVGEQLAEPRTAG